MRRNNSFINEFLGEVEKPIKEGRKVVASDYSLDEWIAAHYDHNGEFPLSKPEGIPSQIFDRLKIYHKEK